MQKDPIENHSDRNSTWTEDEVPQHHVATPQYKQPAQQTQIIQQIQVQPKQQASVQVPKKKVRIDQPPIQDDIDEQETIQEKLAALQKEKEKYSISDSNNEQQQVIGEIDNNNKLTPNQAQKQLQEMIQQSIFSETVKQQKQTVRAKVQQRIVSLLPRMIITGMNKDQPNIQTQLPSSSTQKPTHRSEVKQSKKQAERELELFQASQQRQQYKNTNLNNTNIETPDIQRTIGQLTGLQPSSGAKNLGLYAGPRQKEAGSISANNRERTEPQINEGHEDNAEEEEDEQTDEAALNQNKDYRVNIISQPYQKEKDNLGPAPVGVLEKLKQRKESKNSKTEGLNASDEPSQGSNAQAQTKSTFKVPKPKRSIAPDRAGTLQPGEVSVEISPWNRQEERADGNGSSGDGRKDWKIVIQREKRWNGGKDQQIHINMETNRERRFHKYWILFEIQRLEQLIKIKGKQNDNPIQGNIRREESLSRNVKGRVGRRNSNSNLTRPSEMVEPYILDKETQWNMEKDSGCNYAYKAMPFGTKHSPIFFAEAIESMLRQI
ncbi:MAG: hypothetical protein EZS28_026727 [Streblomastix strix]|uniref:Uncharacterized protein n=1 Tax=Streblomastix strix TaxID=222440 RepID=A0A5J4V4P6_9EUKA|nr:MAG: hypothetical protein EZS28_026727 [Streblomastix strix]